MRCPTISHLKKQFTILATSLPLLAASISNAQAVSLIRDAEIEHTLRTFGDPIFKTAGLEPKNIHIFVVNDDSINAFVAGGSNMFIHTGLIKATRNASMLLGVMAHETGHIAGGHLARGAEQLRNAQLGAIFGYVLGAAAAAAGNADIGMAVMTGGQNAAMRNFLSFTRSNEEAADQAGLSYLDKLGISASGMMQMFQTLYRQEIQKFGTPDPYTLTHPLSAERIAFVRNHVEHSPFPEDNTPTNYNALQQRMHAKLYAFLETPPKTFARYPKTDTSVAARMARAIAWHKTPDPAKAIAEITSLTTEYPKDAYLWDLQGQIYFENSYIKEALAAYSQAANLAPDSALILTSLGEAEIASKIPENIHKAITHLEKATILDNTNASSWRALATAYGKSGNNAMAHLSLAEEAALNNQAVICKRETKSALDTLIPGTPARLRAEDLKTLCNEMELKKDSSE